jgi:hypothetical protein
MCATFRRRSALQHSRKQGMSLATFSSISSHSLGLRMWTRSRLQCLFAVELMSPEAVGTWLTLFCVGMTVGVKNSHFGTKI